MGRQAEGFAARVGVRRPRSNARESSGAAARVHSATRRSSEACTSWSNRGEDVFRRSPSPVARVDSTSALLEPSPHRLNPRTSDRLTRPIVFQQRPDFETHKTNGRQEPIETHPSRPIRRGCSMDHIIPRCSPSAPTSGQRTERMSGAVRTRSVLVVAFWTDRDSRNRRDGAERNVAPARPALASHPASAVRGPHRTWHVATGKPRPGATNQRRKAPQVTTPPPPSDTCAARGDGAWTDPELAFGDAKAERDLD